MGSEPGCEIAGGEIMPKLYVPQQDYALFEAEMSSRNPTEFTLPSGVKVWLGCRPRNPKWPKESKLYMKGKCCERCGRRDQLVVHHVIPVHVNPDHEMDPDNWMIGCFGPIACHLNYHLLDFRSWDPNAREEAKRMRAKVEARPYVKD